MVVHVCCDLMLPFLPQALPPCPYYSRGGYCPRQPFCKFGHDHFPVSSADCLTTPTSERAGDGMARQALLPDYFRSISLPERQYTHTSSDTHRVDDSKTTATVDNEDGTKLIPDILSPTQTTPTHDTTSSSSVAAGSGANGDSKHPTSEVAAAELVQLPGNKSPTEKDDDDEDVVVKSKRQVQSQNQEVSELTGMDLEDVERIMMEAETVSRQVPYYQHNVLHVNV